MAGRPKPLTPRQQEAVSLKLAGASYRQIADALGSNPGTVYRLVKNALPAREESEEELRWELARLDQVQMSIWPQVRSGDLQAVTTWLKLVDVRERVRQRYYLRGPEVVVNNSQTNISSDQGVLVIQGQTKDEYIAGLRAARGELPPNGSPPRGELPAPQSGDGLGQQLLDENRPANQGVPAVADSRLDGHVQVPGLVDESGDL
jgi:hypothetical protein